MVEEPARGRDDDVDAAAKRLLLRPERHTPDDRGDADPGVAREAPRVVFDLRGELAGRREDERARRTLALGEQALENRQHERGGLAAPGHRARKHVAAGEADGNGGILDGRRRLEAEIGDPAQQRRVKRELSKRHGTTFRQSSAGFLSSRAPGCGRRPEAAVYWNEERRSRQRSV